MDTQTPHRIVIMHDPVPDLSWVDDDPNDHVTLAMLAYDEDGEHVDSLFGIDFYETGDNWDIGTFYKVSQIPSQCAYLREIATEMGLPA